ncbi:MAG: tetratricopeptide repeat protein [Spirochaetes bacterium]|nr:tetratricopeptide repeat protein [Spirochaetota bacterium]
MSVPLVILGLIIFILFGLYLSFILKTYVFPRRLNQIAKMIDQGNTRSAIKALKTFISKNERNILAHWYLGECYYRDKRFELAIVEYKYAVKIGTFSQALPEATVRKRLAEIYRKFNQLDEAQKELILVSNLEPDNFEINFQIGETFYLRNLTDNAVAYFQKAIRLNPQHSESHYYLGVIYNRTGKLELAQTELAKAIQYDPKNYHAHLYLGLVYKTLGQFETASKEFEIASRDSEIKIRALLENGKSFFERGNFPKAISEMERALKFTREENEVSLEARYWLAACYERTRDLPSAIEQWEIISQHRPSYKDVPEKLTVYADLRADDRLKDFLTASVSNFQTICQQVINGIGYDVIETVPHSDEGVDIIGLEKETRWRNTRRQKAYMKIRRITQPIGELILRELQEDMKKNGAQRGMVITTSTFAPSALEYASTRPIDLIDKKKLTDILRNITFSGNTEKTS